ncbi:P-loop NTPase family protein [Helicovermis profundi]|uniref:Uncharacterized protein n=1 Tax=Helicovermis profundi TaxID=3065157 RepID=A0AAU9EBC3_9FIRM|nr:hypothetical protein HLPR_01730 [Clostridia bacterium S502]
MLKITVKVEKRIEGLRNEFDKFDNWILSGSLCGWGNPLIPCFDLVIFLKLPPEVRMKRLRNREKGRYGDEIKIGKSRYQKYVEFMDWASKYDEGDENIRSLVLHNKWLEEINCQMLRIEEDIDLDEKVKKINKTS